MDANALYRLVFAVWRCLRVGAVLSIEIALGLLLRWTSPAWLSPGQPAAVGRRAADGVSLDHLVVCAAAGLAWVALGLLAISTMITLALVPVRRVVAPLPAVERLAGPLWWRRAVLAACGLSLAAPVAAHAAPQGHGPSHECAVACPGHPSPSVLSGLPLPDLPDAAHAMAPRTRIRIVRPGDSLWIIAREALGPSPSDSDVCRGVGLLYAANRRVIGPDPDLIFPGTELTQPGGTP
jgi:hypothetical protein